ncbi:hypothetical protein HQ545_00725 [Candidatus Woesearchaeota archaeon]|nr:hypothetical protein [Candidatus Woesearchaeota archaeon]
MAKKDKSKQERDSQHHIDLEGALEVLEKESVNFNPETARTADDTIEEKVHNPEEDTHYDDVNTDQEEIPRYKGEESFIKDRYVDQDLLRKKIIKKEQETLNNMSPEEQEEFIKEQVKTHDEVIRLGAQTLPFLEFQIRETPEIYDNPEDIQRQLDEIKDYMISCTKPSKREIVDKEIKAMISAEKAGLAGRVAMYFGIGYKKPVTLKKDFPELYRDVKRDLRTVYKLMRKDEKEELKEKRRQEKQAKTNNAAINPTKDYFSGFMKKAGAVALVGIGAVGTYIGISNYLNSDDTQQNKDAEPHFTIQQKTPPALPAHIGNTSLNDVIYNITKTDNTVVTLDEQQITASPVDSGSDDNLILNYDFNSDEYNDPASFEQDILSRYKSGQRVFNLYGFSSTDSNDAQSKAPRRGRDRSWDARNLLVAFKDKNDLEDMVIGQVKGYEGINIFGRDAADNRIVLVSEERYTLDGLVEQFGSRRSRVAQTVKIQPMETEVAQAPTPTVPSEPSNPEDTAVAQATPQPEPTSPTTEPSSKCLLTLEMEQGSSEYSDPNAFKILSQTVREWYSKGHRDISIAGFASIDYAGDRNNNDQHGNDVIAMDRAIKTRNDVRTLDLAGLNIIQVRSYGETETWGNNFGDNRRVVIGVGDERIKDPDKYQATIAVLRALEASEPSCAEQSDTTGASASVDDVGALPYLRFKRLAPITEIYRVTDNTITESRNGVTKHTVLDSPRDDVIERQRAKDVATIPQENDDVAEQTYTFDQLAPITEIYSITDNTITTSSNNNTKHTVLDSPRDDVAEPKLPNFDLCAAADDDYVSIEIEQDGKIYVERPATENLGNRLFADMDLNYNDGAHDISDEITDDGLEAYEHNDLPDFSRVSALAGDDYISIEIEEDGKTHVEQHEVSNSLYNTLFADTGDLNFNDGANDISDAFKAEQPRNYSSADKALIAATYAECALGNNDREELDDMLENYGCSVEQAENFYVDDALSRIEERAPKHSQVVSKYDTEDYNEQRCA